jgi:hypothetical protein
MIILKEYYLLLFTLISHRLTLRVLVIVHVTYLNGREEYCYSF